MRILILLSSLFGSALATSNYLQGFRCNDQDPNWMHSRPDATSGQTVSEFCPDAKLVFKKVPESSDAKITFKLATISPIPMMTLSESKGMVDMWSKDKTDFASGMYGFAENTMPTVEFCGNADIVVALTFDTDGNALEDFVSMPVNIPCAKAEDQDLALRVNTDLTKLPTGKIAPGTENVFDAVGLTEVAVYSEGSVDFPATTSMSKVIVTASLYNDQQLHAKWAELKDSQVVSYS